MASSKIFFAFAFVLTFVLAFSTGAALPKNSKVYPKGDFVHGDTWSSADGRITWKPPHLENSRRMETTNRRTDKEWTFVGTDTSTRTKLAGSLTAKVDPGLAIEAQTTFTNTISYPAGCQGTACNKVEISAQVTLDSAPCNLLDITFTVHASLTISLGKTSVGTCVLGNVMQCFYDAMKTAGHETEMTQWIGAVAPAGGTKGPKGFTCSSESDPWPCLAGQGYEGRAACEASTCKITQFTVPMGTFTKTINFAADVTKIKLKLSSLLVDIGTSGSETGVLATAAAVGKLMKYTGTDVMWYVTPNSLVTMFTGVQLAITMEVSAFDISKSTLPAKSDLTSALTLLGAPLSNLATKALFDDKMDFLNLVLKYEPGNHVPSWCKKDTAGNYLIQLGTVSAACSKDPAGFGLEIAGIPTGADPKDISATLIDIVKKTASTDMQKMLGDCTSTSWPMTIPDVTPVAKTAGTLICAFQNVKTTTTRRGTTKIEGTTHPGAGMNGAGLNSVMKQAIAKGGATLSLNGKKFPIPMVQAGITTCTPAQKTAAGTSGGCGDVAAAAKSSPSSGGGGGSAPAPAPPAAAGGGGSAPAPAPPAAAGGGGSAPAASPSSGDDNHSISTGGVVAIVIVCLVFGVLLGTSVAHYTGVVTVPEQYGGGHIPRKQQAAADEPKDGEAIVPEAAMTAMTAPKGYESKATVFAKIV